MDRDQLARRNDLLQKVAAIKESEPAPAVLATDHVEVCIASWCGDPYPSDRACPCLMPYCKATIATKQRLKGQQRLWR